MNALIPVNVHADDLEVIQRTAKLLAVSGYFDAKGDTPMAIAQVATKILAGRELGFGPFAAVNGIHIIQGKPAVGANLMASAVKGSGRYDYHVRKMSDDEVSIEFFAVRSAGAIRESLGVSSFTLKDATAAGLTSNPTWKKFSRNMLFARAMSNGVRWYCPDVFSGNAVYVPEELGASVDGDGNVIDVDPPRRTVDAATGEITPAPAPQPRPAPPVQPQADVDGDVIFARNSPWYVDARNNTTNGVRKLCDTTLELHHTGGPASSKQYGWLCGLIDGIVEQATGAEDAHKRVLPVLCQAEISGANPPSAALASKMLDRLATHIKNDAGEKVENPEYSKPVADAMIAIYRAAEAVGTPSLLPA